MKFHIFCCPPSLEWKRAKEKNKFVLENKRRSEFRGICRYIGQSRGILLSALASFAQTLFPSFDHPFQSHIPDTYVITTEAIQFLPQVFYSAPRSQLPSALGFFGD